MQDLLNSIGKPVWITLMVIGFIWFWPVGLAILAYLVWSGRLGSKSNLFVWPSTAKFWGSGNQAFDEHKRDVIDQLEKEQEAFSDYIEKVRKAKDRAEFDQFTADRAKAR